MNNHPGSADGLCLPYNRAVTNHEEMAEDFASYRKDNCYPHRSSIEVVAL